MKKGFTLSELMIALGVLGILCATVLPAITNNLPNQNKILIKRAYYNTTNIVKDLINDSYLYDPLNNETGTLYLGLDNTNEITYYGKKFSGAGKFPDLFIEKLNTKGNIDTSKGNCYFEISEPSVLTGSTTTMDLCRTFSTSDGMKWIIGVPPGFGTVQNPSIAAAYMLIDVNGNKKPNCYQGSEACEGRNKNFDQFKIAVYPNGQVYLDPKDVWAVKAINPNASITQDD